MLEIKGMFDSSFRFQSEQDIRLSGREVLATPIVRTCCCFNRSALRARHCAYVMDGAGGCLVNMHHRFQSGGGEAMGDGELSVDPQSEDPSRPCQTTGVSAAEPRGTNQDSSASPV